MIVVKLMGGLGNQLFQYAAAKSLAIKHRVDFKFDLSFLNENPNGAYTKRNYELSVFNINEKFVSESELAKIKKIRDSKLLRNLSYKFPNLFSTYYGKETKHSFNEQFKHFPANTYLDGFWQSENYFKDVAQDIRNDLYFKPPINDQNQTFLQRIKQTNSISIHVRRTDYVANENVLNFHGICTVDYYQKALDTILQKVESPTLFFFSDDPKWVETNLKFNLPSFYIDFNTGEKSYEDLRLMSACKHHIIANSSFSWWGAWLNPSKEKIVIAPKTWFADTSIDTSDVIPTDWIKI
ncbi:MAG: alpha-1,2-fucosyltransferase [Bacteroidetes bacterium]|nr:alpha-1,2-fucosyltransferase [Bacteroidota bacterium]